MKQKQIRFHLKNIEVKNSTEIESRFDFCLPGKVLLIIVTATYCRYTRQYPYLNQLKAHYRSDNFEILAFPCNQFGLVRKRSFHCRAFDVFLL